MKNIKFKMLVVISIVVTSVGLFSFINKAERINGANIVTLQVIQQMDLGVFKGKISIIEPRPSLPDSTGTDLLLKQSRLLI